MTSDNNRDHVKSKRLGRIRELQDLYGGQDPSTISREILAEMLSLAPDTSEYGQKIRAAICDENPRSVHKNLIRANCLDCCAGARSEIAKCISVTCPFWALRNGQNPFRKKVKPSPAQLASLNRQNQA
jgi:hypothetical protein